MAVNKNSLISKVNRPQDVIDETGNNSNPIIFVGKKKFGKEVSEDESDYNKLIQKVPSHEKAGSQIYSVESDMRPIGQLLYNANDDIAHQMKSHKKRYVSCKTATNLREIHKMAPHVHTAEYSSKLTSSNQQQPLDGTQNHHQHAPSCLASKLVNIELSSRVRQHQPHCIHHKPIYSRQQQVSKIDDTKFNAILESKYKPVKYSKQQDKSYSLKYRPFQTEFHATGQSSNNNKGHQQQNGRTNERYQDMVMSHNNKRSTIKFISQLYFLLHLAAILSLLLHHKNLVISEKKLVHHSDDLNTLGEHYVKKHTTNESLPGQQVISLSTTTTSVFNQLPVPLMLQIQNSNHNSNSQLISSVVMTSATNIPSKFNQSRIGRQIVSSQVSIGSADILVRLIGNWYAKYALLYFLCYLLSSSVIILVCLQFFRMCNWPNDRNSRHTDSTNDIDSNVNLKTDSVSDGFYYLTRLDCTPVLIGSISLGLIQLIVIGLDIANNIDWLSDKRWPIYLPFLQFAFVSLLMQYILGRVAKNHEQKKSIESNRIGKREPRERQLALSINDRKRANNREVFSPRSSESPISNGLQNITLAHLLVTHILLWLMKLNSISLFQAIDHQQQQSFSSNAVVVVASPANKFHPNHNSFDTQSAKVPFSAENLYSQKENKQHNRMELENILRRKLPGLNTKAALSEVPLLDDDSKLQQNNESQVSVPSEIRGEIENLTSGEDNTNKRIRLPTALSNKLPEKASMSNMALKNERGLRSTADVLSHMSSPRDTNGTHGLVNLVSNSERKSPSSSNPNSMSQAQLSSLLNQISKEQLVSERQRQPPQSNVTTKIFKSSLPKRMTSFRQAKPSLKSGHLRGNTNLSLEPLSITTTTAMPVVISNTTSLAFKQSKQKVRILFSPSNASEFDEKRRGKQGKIGDVSSTNKPFPSVESDPPTTQSNKGFTVGNESTLIPELARNLSVSKEKTEKMHGVGERLQESKMRNGSGMEQDLKEEKSASLDTEEEIEPAGLDLDSLLPPVPNYNETTDNHPVGEKKVFARRPRMLNETFDGKKTSYLKEDTFVFNEAASAINITITPPITIKNEADDQNNTLDNARFELRKEALVVQNEHQYQKSQPTFADYLLPIVHQYHILIIAILFNMWLDSLRENANDFRFNRLNQNNLAPKLITSRDIVTTLGSPNSSEIGPVSHFCGSGTLIAIPIVGNGKHRHFEVGQMTEPKYIAASASGDGYALERVHNHLWRHNERKHYRSRSMDSLHHRHQTAAMATEETGSDASSLSRYNSLRSSSSRQLLWIPSTQLRSRAKSPLLGRKLSDRSFESPSLSLTTQSSVSLGQAKQGQHFRPRAGNRQPNGDMKEDEPINSVWSVFFGLLIVSTSLIVILLGIDLLSILTQCLTQFISILACLLGLCLILIFKKRSRRHIAVRSFRLRNKQARNGQLQLLTQKRAAYSTDPHDTSADCVRAKQVNGAQQQQLINSHRQCFHYLFLLAAYYCGLSIALNLNKQHSVQQVFPHHVIQFIQRHLNQSSHFLLYSSHHRSDSQAPLSAANYLALFHLLLALKGLILIVQVTLQTVLIRASCQRGTRELRQVYTFLMFANLSLWAMEICEQQQHLQREADYSDATMDKFKLVTFDSSTRFAASIVTLSHLYHGLVFMQH